MDDKDEAIKTHREEACRNMSPIGRKLFKYVEFDEKEELIAEIRKHPIGYILIALTGIFISLTLVLSTLALALGLDGFGVGTSDTNGGTKALIIIVGIVLGLLALGATAIGIVLYERNVVYVTDQKLAEVSYIILFNRKVTQLGIGQIEDVTVLQKGIFARVFDYGTLVIETAGETQNATFTVVPKPNYYSQKIIQAHEENVQKYGN